MTSKSSISQLSAPLIAFVLAVVLAFAAFVSPVHAVEDARKVSVVSFGLFGDQGVFAARRPVQRRSSPIVSGAARSTSNTIRGRAEVQRSKP